MLRRNWNFWVCLLNMTIEKHISPGWKFAEYELKGVPVRLALGNRDLENKTIEIARRDTMEKKLIKFQMLEKRLLIYYKISKIIYIKSQKILERKILLLQIIIKNLKIILKQVGSFMLIGMEVLKLKKSLSKKQRQLLGVFLQE